MKNKLVSLATLVFLALAIPLQAQELNARVTVNSDRIQGTDKRIFTSMESKLNDIINGTKWTSVTFAGNEKIDCTFSLIILEQPSDYTFKAELFVQARRPVYNSAYVTTTLNYRDTKFEFEYMEGAILPVTMQQSTLSSNLEAVISFYVYLILALDFDSFSPSGGNAFYRQAQAIANMAQSSGWTGWSSFDDNKNRGSIITAYTDESLRNYHELWYTYHRKGLDEMAANPDRARMTIVNALPVLKEMRQIRFSEMLLQMFADSKLDEAVSIASKATPDEKKELYDLLRSVFPSMSGQIEPLKK